MHFLNSQPKRLALVNFLALQFFLVRSLYFLNVTNLYVNHKCRNYQSQKFEKNLDSLISSMSSDNFTNGFETSAFNEDNVTAAIIFGCRGDTHGSKCNSCFRTAITDLRKRCKRNNGGIIWYDQCFIDVSNKNRSPRKMDDEDTFSVRNPESVDGAVHLFDKDKRDLFYKLTQEATRGFFKEPTYYAAGKKDIMRYELFAMVQCAKDILDCKACLERNIKELSKCCDGRQGGRVLNTACSIRYEMYPFLRKQKKSL